MVLGILYSRSDFFTAHWSVTFQTADLLFELQGSAADEANTHLTFFSVEFASIREREKP